MAQLQRKSLQRPDERRPLGRGRLELVELGEAAIGRVTYEPGWRWSEDVRPLVGTASCEAHHIGVVIAGSLRVQMNDGTAVDLTADDVFEIPPGHDAWVLGDKPWIAVDSLGRRYFGKAAEEDDRRVLGSILFTDVVGSTATAARMGDAAWRGTLAELNVATVGEIERHRGREVASTGDGILAVFDSPTRAVRCALGLIGVANRLDLHLRAGVHTGEYQPMGGEVRGVAVHVAARVMATSGSDELRVSAATAALLERSGLTVTGVGVHELKGVPDPVELFSIARTAEAAQ
jgi:class 3 adenylate cyclase